MTIPLITAAAIVGLVVYKGGSSSKQQKLDENELIQQMRKAFNGKKLVVIDHGYSLGAGYYLKFSLNLSIIFVGSVKMPEYLQNLQRIEMGEDHPGSVAFLPTGIDAKKAQERLNDPEKLVISIGEGTVTFSETVKQVNVSASEAPRILNSALGLAPILS